LLQVRWRTFVNSLRTVAGGFELLSKVIIGVMVLFAGIGGAIGLGAGAWFLVSSENSVWLAMLLWPVFLFWQTFPILATAFTENLDIADLLRFPLTYRAYFLVRLVYGSLDIATLLCSFWLAGMAIGLGVARPALFPVAALLLLIFAGTNIFLARTMFAWMERWLAQRRTREIFGILFFLIIVGFQLIGPLLSRYGGVHNRSAWRRRASELIPVQSLLPPGLAGAALDAFVRHYWPAGLAFTATLAAYGAVFLWLLHRRLRAQFRGENLSEDQAAASQRQIAGRCLSWKLPLLPAPVAAVYEKEMHCFLRSGPVLLTVAVPALVLVILRASLTRASKPGIFGAGADYAFPVGAVYSLLMLTNLVYNSFGADSGGVQLLFTAPVHLRSVVLGKNLAHASVLMACTALVLTAASLLYHPPQPAVLLATLSWLMFAAPVNLAVGNLLSVFAPKRVDYSVFGRQRAPQANILVSLGVQVVIFGVAAPVVWSARAAGNLWLAVPAFLVLAALTIAGYVMVLGRAGNLAMNRRETLIRELSKV
jgi:ABC-2 type transport system permease protein